MSDSYKDFYLNYIRFILQTCKYLNNDCDFKDVCLCSNHCQECFRCACDYRNETHTEHIATREKFLSEIPFILMNQDEEDQDIVDKKSELNIYLTDHPIPDDKKQMFIRMIHTNFEKFAKQSAD